MSETRAHDPRSVLTRSAPEPDATVRYGEHPDHVIDLYRPAGVPRGTLVFFHGGFWRSEYDRVHVRPLAVALAAEGWLIAAPEFRRTGEPGGGWPGTLDDVAAAVRAVAAEGPLVLAGHSAGGHLALWAARGLAREQGGPGREQGIVRAVVGLAPVADLADAYERDLDGGAVAALLGGGPADVPQRYAAADPMALLPVGVQQVLVHGARDGVVPPEMSRRYVAAARSAGDQVELVELSDVEHFAIIDPLSAVWPQVVAVIAGVGSRP